MPVTIIDSLRRGGSGISPFFTTQEADAKVSYLTVADIPARDAVEEWKRLPFMQVFVISTNTAYRLGVNTTIAGQVWTAISTVPDGTYQLVVEKNQPSGYVGLEVNGKINPIYIDNIYSNTSYVVTSLAARNALSTLTGDIVITTDTSQIWVKLNNDPAPTDAGDFAELQFPGAVLSVNGQTGIVTITMANLLAVPQNATDLNTFINTSTSILALNSTVAGHTIQIADLEADVAALQAELAGPSTVPNYDINTIYAINQLVKYQETSGRYNLYVANAPVPVSEVPGVSTLWNRMGDYYTTTEIDNLLALKADLVGGAVPLNQLPAAALAMTHIAANLTERNLILPRVTGMRVYVTANGAKYIYQPGHGLADIEGYVTELDATGGAGGGGHDIQTEGNLLPTETNLNFTNGLSAADNPGGSATDAKLGGTLTEATEIDASANELKLKAGFTALKVRSRPAFNAGNARMVPYILVESPITGDIFFVGAQGTVWNGVTLGTLCKMSAEGVLDATFTANLGVGPTGTANGLMVTSTGMLIVWGFSGWNGISTDKYIKAVNPDGTLNTVFNTNIGTNTANGGSYPRNIVELPSGDFLVSGYFSQWNGDTGAKKLIKLSATGVLDASWHLNRGTDFDGSNGMNWIAVQADGKIVCVGNFQSVGGLTTLYGVCRINADGTVDTAFTTAGGQGAFVSGGNWWDKVYIQPATQKIVIWDANYANLYDRVVVDRGVLRLNTDGSVDTAFMTSFKGSIGTLRDGEPLEVQTIEDLWMFADGSFLMTSRGSNFKGVELPYSVWRTDVDGNFLEYMKSPNMAVLQRNDWNSSWWPTINYLFGMMPVEGSTTTESTWRLVRYLYPSFEYNTVPAGTLNVWTEDVVELEGDRFINTKPTNALTVQASHQIASKEYTEQKLDEISFESGIQRVVGNYAAKLKVTIGGILTALRTIYSSTFEFFIKAGNDAYIQWKPSFYIGIGVNGTSSQVHQDASGNLYFVSYTTTWGGVPVGRGLVKTTSEGVLISSSNNTNGLYAAYAGSVQADGKVILGGTLGKRQVVRLLSTLAIDTGFDVGTDFVSVTTMSTLAAQADGKVLVGGQFNYKGTTVRLKRLESNGTEDTVFSTAIGLGPQVALVRKIIVNADTTILVAGQFVGWNGNAGVYKLTRLLADGTLDPAFTNGTVVWDCVGIDKQSSGKIIAVMNQSGAGAIQRLNTDGTNDATFVVGTGPNTALGAYASVKVSPVDDSVVVYGNFTTWNGVSTPNLVRLTSDGAIHPDWVVNTSGVSQPSTQGTSGDYLAVQANGKIVMISPSLTYHGFASSKYIRRLHPNGLIDGGEINVHGSLLKYTEDMGGLATSDRHIIDKGYADRKTVLSKSVSLYSPSGAENITLFYTNVAMTITKVIDAVQGTTPSVTYQINHAATRNSGSPNTLFSAGRTITLAAGAETTTFNDPTIPAGSWVWITTSAVSGTVLDCAITMMYKND